MEEFPKANTQEHALEVLTKRVTRELLPDERIYTPEEVYTCIEQFQGVQRNQFRKVTHFLNQDGVLVEIELDLEEQVSREKFKCRTGYTFLLKVKPGTKGSRVTEVQRFDYDKDGIVDFGRTVAEVVENAWVAKE